MRLTIIILSLLITTIPSLAKDAMAGDEVYRWVDENGVVHFGDRPPGGADAELVPVKASKPANNPDPSAADTVSTDTPGGPQPTLAEQLREERAEKRAQKAENNKIIAEACEQRRAIVSQLEPSTRVMVTHEDGTVTRMDDNDRLETLDEAKTYIAQNCEN